MQPHKSTVIDKGTTPIALASKSADSVWLASDVDGSRAVRCIWQARLPRYSDASNDHAYSFVNYDDRCRCASSQIYLIANLLGCRFFGVFVCFKSSFIDFRSNYSKALDFFHIVCTSALKIFISPYLCCCCISIISYKITRHKTFRARLAAERRKAKQRKKIIKFI